MRSFIENAAVLFPHIDLHGLRVGEFCTFNVQAVKTETSYLQYPFMFAFLSIELMFVTSFMLYSGLLI